MSNPDRDDADPERDKMADAVQAGVASLPGHERVVVTEFVVLAVMYTEQGEKLFDSWTAPDQRQWTSLGLIELYKLDNQAFVTERRLKEGQP